MEGLNAGKERLSIDRALGSSLELLRSKIGTVVISGQDKYRFAYDKIMEEKENLIARAISEKLSQDVIDSECDGLINRTNEFDRKMQELAA